MQICCKIYDKINKSKNDSCHVFSDAYDFVQNAVCFLCEFVGKSLNDVYMIKNGQEITIKKATYLLVGRTIDRMRRYMSRSRDINDYTEKLSVEIDHYEEKDYTEVDNKIELLNLKPRDRAVLDCYMDGITCNEIADFLDHVDVDEDEAAKFVDAVFFKQAFVGKIHELVAEGNASEEALLEALGAPSFPLEGTKDVISFDITADYLKAVVNDLRKLGILTGKDGKIKNT